MNWYAGEELQDAGVAVETQGFTLVSHGKVRSDLSGRSVLTTNAHLRTVTERLSEKDRSAFADWCVNVYGGCAACAYVRVIPVSTFFLQPAWRGDNVWRAFDGVS